MHRYTVWDTLTAAQCDRSFWLSRHKDGATPCGTTESRIPLCCEAASALCPGCVCIDTEDDAQAVQATLQAVRSGAAAICGAAAQTDRLFCRADCIECRQDGTWRMYIDCGSVHMREAVAREAAYIANVLETIGIIFTEFVALTPDPNYVRGRQIDWNRLYGRTEISDRVKWHRKAVQNHAKRLPAIDAMESEPELLLHESCLKPRECRHWRYCSSSLPSPNIFDISGVNNRRKFQLYRLGVVSYEDCLRYAKLTRQQIAQVKAENQNEPASIDRAALRAFLQSLWYPICFLDFESFQKSVPPFEGIAPFEQVAFQYSLHIQDAPDAPLSHHVFLADPCMDPREPMAKSLAEHIPENACVVVYSSGLEKHILHKLAARYPLYERKLRKAAESIRDLIVPFRSRFYYSREMRGSCSLKNVAPALCPELNYGSLEEVHNGEDAMRAYLRLGSLPDDEREAACERLIAYNSMDTYAMVRILDTLREAMR